MEENKLILNDIIVARSIFIKLYEIYSDPEKNLPIESSYTISKFIDDANKELVAYDKEKEKIVRKLGKEFDGQIRVSDENIEEFQKEHIKLIEIEAVFNGKLIDLNNMKSINIPPNQMMAILKFIKE